MGLHVEGLINLKDPLSGGSEEEEEKDDPQKTIERLQQDRKMAQAHVRELQGTEAGVSWEGYFSIQRMALPSWSSPWEGQKEEMKAFMYELPQEVRNNVSEEFGLKRGQPEQRGDSNPLQHCPWDLTSPEDLCSPVKSEP